MIFTSLHSLYVSLFIPLTSLFIPSTSFYLYASFFIPLTSPSSFPYPLSISTSTSLSSFPRIKACLSGSKDELKRFRNLPPSLRGPELLRIFFLDVIGRDTRECKVLQNNLYVHIGD